jgi:hypothetical protein
MSRNYFQVVFVVNNYDTGIGNDLAIIWKKSRPIDLYVTK